MKTVPENPALLALKSRVFQKYYRGVNRIPYMPSQYNYNITVCKNHKFLWYRVAKVCTRTILHHFKEKDVCLDAEHPSFIHYSPRNFDGYFKFAFVRNPWDRLVSCWFNKVIRMNYFHFNKPKLEKMKCFSNFVHFVSKLDIENCDRHLCLQSRLIDLNNIDFLGRFENFKEDFLYVCQRLDIPAGPVKERNVSAGKKKYSEYYDDVLIEKVSQIYQKDIQLFGYYF